MTGVQTCALPICAYDIDTYDGSEDSNTRNQIGYGRTEIEAIKDLLSILEEYNDEKNVQS